jgi:uncharacterized membrane protein YvbJ
MKHIFKKIVALVVIIIVSTTYLYSQNMATVIKAQALEMARAIAKKDFEKVATFMHPSLSSEAKNKMQAPGMMDSLNKAMAQFKPEVKSIIIGNPGEIVTYKKVMQALLPQEMEIKTTLLSVAFETTLVAISEDGGKKWYFVDANMYKEESIKKKLPELSPKIVLPAMKKPKFIPNKQQ